jgi:hypothetical protein
MSATSTTPSAAAAAEPPPALPPFFRPYSILPEETYRTRIVRKGPVLDSDETTSADTNAKAVKLEVPVLEETKDNVRVRCEAEVRVAVYVPKWELDDVALEGAVLVPTRPSLFDEKTPGVHFVEGTAVTLLGPSADPEMLRCRFKDDDLSAEGLVMAERVGKVYRPTSRKTGSWNGVLPQGGRLVDAPRGRLVAILKPPRDAEGRRLVTKLGPPKEGFVLVRYSTPRYAAVGWIPTYQVRDLDEDGGIGTRGGSSGSGRSYQNPIELEPGVVLRALGTRRPIGVVLRKSKFNCAADCTGDHPRVTVPACHASLDVVADRARGTPP